MSGAPHVFVVTCSVPRGAAERLHVKVERRTVTAEGPDGFTHVFKLPPGVTTELLEWQVFADVLELRAPYRRTP
jgi:hypothetical protein